MADIILTTNYPEELKDEIEMTFNLPDTEEAEKVYAEVFDVVTSFDNHDFQGTSVNPMPLPSRRNQAGANGGASTRETHTTTVTYGNFSQELEYSVEAEQFTSKWGVITDSIDDMRTKADKLREKSAAEYFDNADIASRPDVEGGDLKALLATDHPLGGVEDGSQSNTFTDYVALDPSSLQDILNKLANNYDETGVRDSLMAKSMVVPNNQFSIAKQVLISEGQAFESSNTKNIFPSQGLGEMDLIRMPMMEEQDQWFVCAERKQNKGLVFVDFKELTMYDDQDVKKLTKIIVMHQLFGLAHFDYRAVWGSK